MSFEDRQARLQAIIETQNEITAGKLDLGAVMELVVARAKELTGAAGAVVQRLERDEVVSVVAAGTAEPYKGVRVPLDSSLSGLAVRRCEALYCADARGDDRVDSKSAQTVGAISIVCVPLQDDGDVVGVLKVYSPEPNGFDDDDIETLRLLGDVLVAHLVRATGADSEDDRHDELTGLLNRRAYKQRLTVECERARRHGQPLSLCILDLDGFKRVNDRDGHPAGDTVLRAIAEILDHSRLSDDIFRIGGDEFALLMPQTDKAGATRGAKRIAAAVAASDFASGGMTISFGVAETGGDPVALHYAADAALLEAKGKLGPAQALGDGERDVEAGRSEAAHQAQP